MELVMICKQVTDFFKTVSKESLHVGVNRLSLFVDAEEVVDVLMWESRCFFLIVVDETEESFFFLSRKACMFDVN
jgi:hypothetical protein